jgi:hypothetical protein
LSRAAPAAVRPPTTRLLLVTVVTLLVGVGVFFVLAGESVHFVAANSDGATVVLEGQSMQAGAPLLSGWSLPLDSFFSTEVPVYAAAVALFGLRHDLANAVPAFLATLVVIVGVIIAARPGRGAGRLGGATLVVALLALPSPALAYFFLQGPWHVGTTLACLVAFAAVASGRLGWRALVAVALLAVGLLGDVQTLALGVVPVALDGVVAACRSRSPRAGGPFVAVAAASVGLAYGLRRLFDAIGTFGLVDANPTARFAQVGQNLGHLPSRFAGLFGVGTIPIGSATSPSRLAPGHVVALVVVLAGLVLGVGSLVLGAVGGDARRRVAPGSRTLDDLLVFGIAGDLCAFVFLAATGNGDYARYLTAGVIFSVVLAGRLASRIAGRDRRATVAVLALSGVLLAIGAGAFVLDLRQPRATRPADALGAFLVSHHLTSGLGDYWSSSIVTTSTGGAVTVRPVITTPAGTLARYGRQTTAAWYRGARFSFLVFDLHRPWRSVNATSAAATFGPPREVLTEGTYRVYVFSSPVTISAVGYSNA